MKKRTKKASMNWSMQYQIERLWLGTQIPSQASLGIPIAKLLKEGLSENDVIDIVVSKEPGLGLKLQTSAETNGGEYIRQETSTYECLEVRRRVHRTGDEYIRQETNTYECLEVRR